MVKDLHTEMVNPRRIREILGCNQIELDPTNKSNPKRPQMQTKIIDPLTQALDEAKVKEVK